MAAEAGNNKEVLIADMDVYVPDFEIYLGKKKIGGELRNDIIEVSYSDSLDAIDSFSFTVCNWDAEKRTFKYLDFDKNPFNVGKEVEIWMGYADNLQNMVYGEITTLEPTFPQSGSPTLAVRGLNILHRLRKKQETHSYKGKTDGYIARKISQRLGIKKGRIEKGETHHYLAQKNKYDIVFLLERARRIGYEVVVKDKKLNFQPSTGAGGKVYVLEWGKSMVHFRPTLTTAGQVAKVVVKGWDPVKKKTITGEAKRKDLKTKGLGSSKINKTVEKAFNQKLEIIVDRPIRSKEEAEKLAKEKLEQIAKNMVKGEASTVGCPDLRAGRCVEIRNLGDTFSGTYYITKTSHAVGNGGYTTKFSVRREET